MAELIAKQDVTKTALEFVEEETKANAVLQQAQLDVKKLQLQKEAKVTDFTIQRLQNLDDESKMGDSALDDLPNDENDGNDAVQRYLNSLEEPGCSPHAHVVISQEPQNSNLMQVLVDQSYLNRIPVVEPPTFSGDPLQLINWFQSFRTLEYVSRTTCGET